MNSLDWNNYKESCLIECRLKENPSCPIVAFFDFPCKFWDFYFIYEGRFYKMMTNCNDSVKRDFIVINNIGEGESFRDWLDYIDKYHRLKGIDYPNMVKMLKTNI